MRASEASRARMREASRVPLARLLLTISLDGELARKPRHLLQIKFALGR